MLSHRRHIDDFSPVRPAARPSCPRARSAFCHRYLGHPSIATLGPLWLCNPHQHSKRWSWPESHRPPSRCHRDALLSELQPQRSRYEVPATRSVASEQPRPPPQSAAAHPRASQRHSCAARGTAGGAWAGGGSPRSGEGTRQDPTWVERRGIAPRSLQCESRVLLLNYRPRRPAVIRTALGAPASGGLVK